ncbi:YdcF family protein [Holdemania massiliensis]|uniref:YdcF family protein n=1 Tax=Holdemania massiliensis TaxID=1468449 RepID=UPI001F06C437|nr:YdcF family protein [Holdemania massiliensis]MCH1939410.1 YdcF family protein [Holdemania massiliensis]
MNRKRILIILGGICLGYACLTCLTVSLQFGNAFFLILGMLLICEALIHEKLGKQSKHVINCLGLVGSGIALILIVLMIGAANVRFSSTDVQGSTVIVLGAKINEDRPSLILRRRLQAALTYAQEHPESQIIVTGGQGEGEIYTESAVMKKWLMDNGLEAERIFEENQARNTGENLRYSLELLRQNELSEKVVIVTDSFHQLRASILAKQLGIEQIEAVNSETPLSLIPMYTVREWFGLVKALVLQR